MKPELQEAYMKKKGFRQYIDHRGVDFYACRSYSIRSNGQYWLIWDRQGVQCAPVGFRNPIAAATYTHRAFRYESDGMHG